MNSILSWLDQRTGYKKLLHEALYENVPGGARWRYVWGSTLTFCFSIQILTGLFLWAAYSPSSQSAWESVYFIQNQMSFGWLLRGIHHFTAQAMVVLLVLHLMQVVIDGAYKAPREVNFWFGIGLLFLTLALSLTGYLLPWDQKGFYGTKVTVNIIGNTPLIGPALQKILIGGTEYGHHTLTRFFALHAGFIPGAMIALIAGHVYLFRKHGLTPKLPKKRSDAAFWPDQVLMDAVACLAVLAAVLFLIFRHYPEARGSDLGAELGPPVDLSDTSGSARPEWYFLFLFQFIKYFPGHYTFIGEMVIPGLVMGVICLMPFLGNWRLGHRFNILFLFVMLGGASILTWVALRKDKADLDYQLALNEANLKSERIKVLAKGPSGIPQVGAASLLQSDPLVQGPKLFSKHCASCHRFDGHDGMGRISKEPASAPDLKGFGTRAWIAGLLDPLKVDSRAYFGGTKHDRMIKVVKKEIAEYSTEEKEMLSRVILAISAEAKLRSQREFDRRNAKLVEEGAAILAGEKLNCVECHHFRQSNSKPKAPDLTGYGSEEWLRAFISDPAHPRFYGAKNERMPSFGAKEILSPTEINLIVRWLRGDWYEPGRVADIRNSPPAVH